ncbi:MAG: hypothetical protein Q8L55_00600 [Phycisphaerales bacterium]|nr:hypothetical protein [Phycisphaerales bacterium]
MGGEEDVEAVALDRAAAADELVACIRAKGTNLSLAQRNAINTLRNRIEKPPVMAKIMPLRRLPQSEFDPQAGGFADELLENNSVLSGGSLCDPADIAGATNFNALNDTLRLDYPSSAHLPSEGYAVVECRGFAIHDSASIPRGHGYQTGNGGEYIADRPYPYTGSGFTADKNGKLIPEWTAPPNTELGVGSTMKFRTPQGNPLPQTRSVNGVSRTASDWVLAPVAGQPGRFEWVPL